MERLSQRPTFRDTRGGSGRGGSMRPSRASNLSMLSSMLPDDRTSARDSFESLASVDGERIDYPVPAYALGDQYVLPRWFFLSKSSARIRLTSSRPWRSRP